jgi:hypothetical protein
MRPRSKPAGVTTAPRERDYGDYYYYAAFVLDPDGHNIEAVYHGSRRLTERSDAA